MTLVLLPSATSLAFRTNLAQLVSFLRRARSKDTVFPPPAHRTTTHTLSIAVARGLLSRTILRSASESRSGSTRGFGLRRCNKFLEGTSGLTSSRRRNKEMTGSKQC